MSYYFIAQIKINDPFEYQRYLDKTTEVFKKFNGKYLAVDKRPIILEGNWHYTKTLLIEFEKEDDFLSWYFSEDYQTILKHRLNAADSDSILIKGEN